MTERQVEVTIASRCGVWVRILGVLAGAAGNAGEAATLGVTGGDAPATGASDQAACPARSSRGAGGAPGGLAWRCEVPHPDSTRTGR